MLDNFIEFMTSKTGIIAAIATLISLIGGILGLVRPWAKSVKEKKASVPKLNIAGLKVKAPPPWTDAGEISFNLVNSSGGKAVMTEMMIHITDSGPCDKIKQVEPAAPVPQYNFKVKFDPDIKNYDVRAKKFAPKPEPHSFEKDEVEAYVIEITSSKPWWYKFVLEIDWYETTKSDITNKLRSEEMFLEFLPEKV